MNKILLIDDEDSWVKKFKFAHRETFQEHNLEIVDFVFTEETTIEDIVNEILNSEINLVLLDEKLDSIPGICFSGEDIVNLVRNDTHKNIAIHIISNSPQVFQGNYSVDGIYDKGGINDSRKEDFKKFKDEFPRIARTANRLALASIQTLGKISTLSKNKVIEGISEEEEQELEGLREQIQSICPIADNNDDRNKLLDKLANEQKKLSKILDRIEGKPESDDA